LMVSFLLFSPFSEVHMHAWDPTATGTGRCAGLKRS
jgi:hypothetical protein